MTKREKELARNDMEGRARSALASALCRYYDHTTAGGFELWRVYEWGFIGSLCDIIGIDETTISSKLNSCLKMPYQNAMTELNDVAWDGYAFPPDKFSTDWDDWDGISGGV